VLYLVVEPTNATTTTTATEMGWYSLSTIGLQSVLQEWLNVNNKPCYTGVIEINGDFGRKSHNFPTPCIQRPWNFLTMMGSEKIERKLYQMAEVDM